MVQITAAINHWPVAAVCAVVLLASGCNSAEDPRSSARQRLIGCMSRQDLRCIVELTLIEEREAVGLKDPALAEAFIKYAFGELNLDMQAVPETEGVAVSEYLIGYPYSTTSTPRGVFRIYVSGTDEGALVSDFYSLLILTLATDIGIRRGFGTSGPAKFRGWADFFQREGPNLESKFGMKGTYELRNRAFRSWAELAADMSRRADRAEGLATPAQ